MRRFARHLVQQDNPNPFPGIAALERRHGRPISVRLGSNECLDAPLSALGERFGDDFRELARLYGDPECYELRTALAGLNGAALDQLLVDSGADALIYLCLRAFCEVGDTVVCCAGTYPAFRYFAQATGCRVAEVAYRREGQGLRADLEALLTKVERERAKVVYIANPDNPTGGWLDFAALAAFATRLPEHCSLLLDEAYIDFCAALQPDYGRALPGCARLRSLSKAYALAGLRVGYALAPTEIVEQLNKVRIHYSVGGLAQRAALIALGEPQVRAVLADNAERRSLLSARLTRLGFQVLPSGTNFVSLLLPSAERAQHLVEALLEQDIAVHRPQHPALHSLVRVTLGAAALEPRFLDVLGVQAP